MTLRFLRNKVVEVNPGPDDTVSVSWRLTDDLLKAEVNLWFHIPELEILKAEARLERFPPSFSRGASELISKVEGVSIGSGLRKILAGLLLEPGGSTLLLDAVLECCNAVILHFTRPNIEAGEAITDPDEKLAATRANIKANPRLVRSCIAFQDDSPIMKGLWLLGG
jgi:hypothetical protein